MRSDRSREEQQAQETLRKVQRLENLATLPMYDLSAPEEIDVQIKPDQKISLGKFKPHPLEINVYLAHPQTIRAMKKNIFTCGDDLSELEEWVICSSCKQSSDKQFWHFCPYCAKEWDAQS